MANGTVTHVEESWILIGAKANNSMLVRGGDNPVAMHVQASDSGDLIALIADANDGIAARTGKPLSRSPFAPEKKLVGA